MNRLPRPLTVVALVILGAFCATPNVADDKIEMKKVETSSESNISQSPLLTTWPQTEDGGVPPWSLYDISDFRKAFEIAIAEAEEDYQRIANDPDPPTFENTLVAMEDAGSKLRRLETIFDVHASNLNVGPIPDLERLIVPQLAEHSDRITQNQRLFDRIERVYEASKDGKLDVAQQRLVDDTYKTYVREGAKLSKEKKAQLSQINKRLARLFTDFSQNVLEDEKGYVTWIESSDDLAGLPDSVIAAMKNAASEKGRPEMWAVTNTRSSMDPFLTYADNRKLRETVWRNYYNRGDNGDKFDNNKIISEILKLRAARAKLLGYPTHAHWRLEPTMAKTPDATMKLMLAVWPKALARVEEEVADMQQIADAESPGTKIKPWDYRYYAEKVRKAKYDLDFNEVKPYLQLEKLRDGMFWAAGKLHSLQFKKISDAMVFHPDVSVYRVSGPDDSLVGLFYFDPYAREGKRSGAWMVDYREQSDMGEFIHPIVSNNCNFVKPSPGEVTLISWDDATTLFHEFGHALHGLLSNVKYRTQSGTNVARDYVEFPSQVNEHWLSTPEVLQKFAVHHETGEPMPQELLDKIEKASTFNSGFNTTEYLASALIDMKIHLAGDADIEPDAFERETLQELGMPEQLPMRHRTPHFSHIFSSDSYSAGYYSYLWSDALTADAAEVFEEVGSYYDPEKAKSLRENVFSIGDTIDPAEGFRRFRGRDVDTAALLRKRGFPVE